MSFTAKKNWRECLPDILTRGRAGESVASIARDFGVSRQRMKQIVDKHFPNWKYECSYSARQNAKDEQFKRKWGLKEDTDLYRSKRTKWRNKKYNALNKGISWDLAFSDIQWPTHCPALGIELDYFAEGAQDNSVSFDRIDPSKGYSKDNVVVISNRANRIKNNSEPHELLSVYNFVKSLTCQETE